MKKQYIFYIPTVLLLLSACKKQEIPVYDSVNYIQFTNPALDTIMFSFFFYPNQPEVEIALPVKLIGFMPNQDLNYQVEVESPATTASPDHYTVDAEYRYRAGFLADSVKIKIRNAPDLANKTVILALKITASDEVLPGQLNYIEQVIKINDMVSKPDWWDANMDQFYLGVYSETKFRKFMEVIGVGDLSEYDSSEQRVLMLQFKYYLLEMKDAGTPVLEDDGTDMLSTVPLVG